MRSDAARAGAKAEHWGLDGGSFDVAKKAWKLLAATEEQRAAQSERRKDRSDAADRRGADAEQRALKAVPERHA